MVGASCFSFSGSERAVKRNRPLLKHGEGGILGAGFCLGNCGRSRWERKSQVPGEGEASQGRVGLSTEGGGAPAGRRRRVRFRFGRGSRGVRNHKAAVVARADAQPDAVKPLRTHRRGESLSGTEKRSQSACGEPTRHFGRGGRRNPRFGGSLCSVAQSTQPRYPGQSRSAAAKTGVEKAAVVVGGVLREKESAPRRRGERRTVRPRLRRYPARSSRRRRCRASFPSAAWRCAAGSEPSVCRAQPRENAFAVSQGNCAAVRKSVSRV